MLVLDEPSTGLHASDVTHLAAVLVRLAEAGNAVVLIEHHTGLLSICDRLVELGPGGGTDGGSLHLARRDAVLLPNGSDGLVGDGLLELAQHLGLAFLILR